MDKEFHFFVFVVSYFFFFLFLRNESSFKFLHYSNSVLLYHRREYEKIRTTEHVRRSI